MDHMIARQIAEKNMPSPASWVSLSTGLKSAVDYSDALTLRLHWERVACLCVWVCNAYSICLCVLTSDIFEVYGLSVGVEELNDRVVIVFDSTAYGGCLPLHYRDVVRYEILALYCRGTERKRIELETEREAGLR